jgi:radical SAM superfamily enzyme YgiQ (UPF0313 family)
MPPITGKIGQGGMAFDDKFGVPGMVAAQNITPDPEFGIGKWTDGEVMRAFREGVNRNGEALFPMMPYANFHAMSDEDARSVLVYLRQLTPVHNQVAKKRIAFPVNLLIKSAPKPLDAPVHTPNDATDHLAEYLNAGFDAALIGEVELTLLDVVRAIMSGREFRQVEGTAWLAAPGQIRRSLPRRLMKDLDALPMPARHLIDLQPYRRAWTAAHGRWSLNLVASRGCPFRCNWCAKPIYGNSFHLRAAASVAEEMRRLKLEHGVQHVWFADDIFALRPSWAEELANEVEIRDAALPFKIQTRADLVTPRFARALARAGCEEVWMGAESGSQKILNAMEKDTRVEHIEEARAHLAAENIGACYFIQFGYPEENWDDIGKTIDLVRRTRPDDIGISVSYPLPGTRFYERVRAQMGAKRNWSDSEDLAVMFRASYNNDFYRALREALHAEVDQWARPAFRSDRERVSATAMAELWATVERLEKTCRNQNPTVLPILTPQYFSSASAD